jgi:oxygen-independent coproporphyrinogen-3 oxidase
LKALDEEMTFVAAQMARCGLFAESIYVGGGTPTTLDETDTEFLAARVARLFRREGTQEFTVEAGRPDTITLGKLRALRAHGVDRVSINPQTMNAATLARIGRSHSVEAVRAAFRMAETAGIPVINTDLIAGLPGETTADFHRSLEEILDLGPQNITLHTLAVKRAARLKETDAEYSYRRAETADAMLAFGRERLAAAGYAPYYLYRLKQTAGNLENVGYARDRAFCLYNIRIMEENQTIAALGAGASTKAYFPKERRLERVFNVSDPALYIARLSEMIERKQRLLFSEGCVVTV